MTWNPLTLIPLAGVVALLAFYRIWRQKHPPPPVEPSKPDTFTAPADGVYAFNGTVSYTVNWVGFSTDGGETWQTLHGTPPDEPTDTPDADRLLQQYDDERLPGSRP